MTLITLLRRNQIIRIWTAINRRLNCSDIQSICLLVLTIYSIVLCVSFATQKSGSTVFGPQLGADFGAFYIAGKMFNSDSADRIYDRSLHRQLYQEHFPSAPSGEELPYINAPFFVLPFSLLARLGYSWAYFIWILI